MSCACGWDKLCSVGQRTWEFLQPCNDWMGVTEAGTLIKTGITRDTALLATALVLQTRQNTCSNLC